MSSFANHLLRQVRLNLVFTHQANANSSNDESKNDEDDNMSEGSEEDEESWTVKSVKSVKYYNTRKRKGWHAMVEWKGDYEDTLQPMTDLIGSACKYFGRVQLISMKVMYLKLFCLPSGGCRASQIKKRFCLKRMKTTNK